MSEHDTDDVLAELEAEDARVAAEDEHYDEEAARDALSLHEAKAAGRSRFLGQACKNGHRGVRHVGGFECVTCSRIRNRERARNGERRELPKVPEERPRTSWLFSLGWQMSPAWRAKVEQMLARAEAMILECNERLDALAANPLDKVQALAGLVAFADHFSRSVTLTSDVDHYVYDCNTATVRHVVPASYEDRVEYERLISAEQEAHQEPGVTRRRLGRLLRSRQRYVNELAADDILIAFKALTPEQQEAHRKSQAVTAEIAALMSDDADLPAPVPKKLSPENAEAREAARAAGAKRFNGAPCPRHGAVERYVSSGTCTACVIARARKSSEVHAVTPTAPKPRLAWSHLESRWIGAATIAAAAAEAAVDPTPTQHQHQGIAA